MNNRPKKTLKMPVQAASDSPKSKEQWDNYWRNVKNIHQQMSKEDRKAYNKKYYAHRKRLREIEKMKELMAKYPQEVQHTLYPETIPKLTAKDMYPLGR